MALLAVAPAPKPDSAALVIEALLIWSVVFNVGLTYVYNFVMHAFFGAMAA